MEKNLNTHINFSAPPQTCGLKKNVKTETIKKKVKYLKKFYNLFLYIKKFKICKGQQKVYIHIWIKRKQHEQKIISNKFVLTPNHPTPKKTFKLGDKCTKRKEKINGWGKNWIKTQEKWVLYEGEARHLKGFIIPECLMGKLFKKKLINRKTNNGKKRKLFN